MEMIPKAERMVALLTMYSTGHSIRAAQSSVGASFIQDCHVFRQEADMSRVEVSGTPRALLHPGLIAAGSTLLIATSVTDFLCAG